MVSYYYGDFHPYTPYGLENNIWMAWQFNNPELGKGSQKLNIYLLKSHIQ